MTFKTGKDDVGNIMPLLKGRSLGMIVDDDLSSTAVQYTLTEGARFVRFYAEGANVYVNLTGTAEDTVTATSADQIVPAGMIIDVILPEGTTVINGITASGDTATLFVILQY